MAYKDFRAAYIEAILFTGAYTSNLSVELEYDIGSKHFSLQSMKIINDDTTSFYNMYSHMWEGYISDDQAGHDFWMTRNRHGVGFWSRGIEDAGYLTKASDIFPEQTLFLDETGTLHLEY